MREDRAAVKKSTPLALVIGASTESVYAIQHARARGIYVLAFDGDPKAVGLNYADESIVTDIRYSENIIRHLNGRRPDLILPVPIGRWLVTTGKINDYFHLAGNGEAVCALCTDKHKFHMFLAEKGLRNCEHILLTAHSSVFPTKYPIILKPRFGSGSRAVSVINSYEELQNTLSLMNPLQEDFIAETRVEGTEYGLDAAVINGQFFPVLLRRKENTPPPACQCVGYYAVCPEEEIYTRVCAFMKNLVAALSLNSCLLHVDLLDAPSGIFVIELSPRPSGHNLHNDFTIVATGINMLEEYISVMLENKAPAFTPVSVKPSLISYFTFENCYIRRLPDSKRLSCYPLTRYVCHLQEGEYLRSFTDGAGLIYRGYYILQSFENKKLKQLRDKLLQEFEVAYE